MRFLVALAVSVFVLPVSVKPVCHPVKRSHAVAVRFMKATGYPHGRPGYVIDHIIPLCACGPDSVTNMQWQTARDAMIKDIEERKQCRELHKGSH